MTYRIRKRGGFLSALAVWLLLCGCGYAAADAPLARLADGSTLTAPVVAMDAQWKVTFLADGARREVSARDLVEWGAPVEPPQATLVLLADGGLLAAETVQVDLQHVTLESGVFGRLQMPRETAVGILLQPPVDRGARDRLMDQLRRRVPDASEELLLANGDRLPGRVREVRAEAVQIDAPGGPIRVEAQRVAAIGLRAAETPAAAFGVWLGLRDGSRLPTAALAWSAQAVRVTWQDRIVSCRPEDAVWLQPRGGRSVYLSDLSATDYRHVPYLTLTRPYAKDRSLGGGMLRCHGRLYAKGLAMPSTSRLTYALPRDARRFEAELGLDDETDRGGSVRFRVFVDGRLKHASPTVRGGDAPLPLSVDVAGAERLDLVVDFADRGDVLDHADWLNARLIR